jgi:hypothetical protein
MIFVLQKGGHVIPVTRQLKIGQFENDLGVMALVQ